MTNHAWVKEFPGSITVSDAEGIILEMNEKAIKTFESQGGAELIGTQLLEISVSPRRAPGQRVHHRKERRP
jgi:hypothetical protein